MHPHAVTNTLLGMLGPPARPQRALGEPSKLDCTSMPHKTVASATRLQRFAPTSRSKDMWLE
eukprot:14061553-Alexandrium_andersonii.AAC.1